MSAVLEGLPSPTESLPEYVYSRMRSAIRTQELKPGDRLREAELVERLGVSRTPVREALKRLQADGLIEPAPPRGFVVTRLTQRRVMELYAMREVLAGVAARFAAEQASPMEIQYLQHLVAQQAHAKAPEEAAALNLGLREAITSAAHNEYLFRAANALNDALDLLGKTTYAMPGRTEASMKENRKIVEAIARRDPAAAEAAARAHIRNAARVRLQMLFGPGAARDTA